MSRIVNIFSTQFGTFFLAEAAKHR